jgi:hypothetical protein
VAAASAPQRPKPHFCDGRHSGQPRACYGHRIRTEWESAMNTNETVKIIERELTETELEQVAGGKPSAAPKQEALPTETITLSYGAIQPQYTNQ